ncbi:MAG: HAMP domain-containing histidine kinase [Bdellovibrionales bacterium]|nr:HAMP domain-containing histidine kinase [Bdellovibrionales bacterium]
MNDSTSALTNEELLRYLNHKFRTPLSFILNELELEKLSGNSEAETSIKKVHDIVNTLKSISELVGYGSVVDKREVSTTEIAKEGIRNLGKARFNSEDSSPSTFLVVPAQIFAAYQQLVTILCNDSRVTGLTVMSVHGGIKTEITFDQEMATGNSTNLQELMRTLELADRVLIKLIANAFEENNLSCVVQQPNPHSLTLVLSSV